MDIVTLCTREKFDELKKEIPVERLDMSLPEEEIEEFKPLLFHGIPLIYVDDLDKVLDKL